MIRFVRLAVVLGLLFSFVRIHANEISVEDLVKFAEFTSVKISPDGRYLAVAMPSGDQTGLQILDVSDPKKGFRSTAAYRFQKLEHVMRIEWTSNDRVVFETTREFDLVGDSVPRLTGMIYAMNADGSNTMVIQGSRRGASGMFGTVVDPLPDDPQNVLIYRKEYGKKPSEIIRTGVFDERNEEILATSPFDAKYALMDGYVLDGELQVRVAYMPDGINETLKFAYRESNDSDWTIHTIPRNEAFQPIGFLPDNTTLVIASRQHPMGYFSLDPRTLERRPLLLDEAVEPSFGVRTFDGRNVIGAAFEDGRLVNRFIDSEHVDARVYQQLEAAFNGLHVEVTSATRDGKLAVVAVSGDRLPTDYYLFNAETKQANFLLASRQWLDPALLSERKPVSFKARDGLLLHGYLTLPRDKAVEKLPLVTVVHGGPHGPRDGWLYDYEAQLLASRGYAVLQTNFRGSGGYGSRFEEAGWRKWGTTIQDDIADGVNWAVQSGIADPERLCIYGASFGGYSVLAQLTRQPDLFKCGFAFVGVYDLEMLYEVGDVQWSREGEIFLERVVGRDTDELKAQSPINFVGAIKAPLYVAHGRNDERAHVNHYLSLLKALDSAKIPYKSMLKYHEGHGFYQMENRVELYSDLVDFIDEHIGDKSP